MQSNGGLAAPEASAPASGAVGAGRRPGRRRRASPRRPGRPRLIAFDMGGTSTDVVALRRRAAAALRDAASRASGCRRRCWTSTRSPPAAARSSLRRRAASRRPGSAGSNPGPACYRQRRPAHASPTSRCCSGGIRPGRASRRVRPARRRSRSMPAVVRARVRGARRRGRRRDGVERARGGIPRRRGRVDGARDPPRLDARRATIRRSSRCSASAAPRRSTPAASPRRSACARSSSIRSPACSRRSGIGARRPAGRCAARAWRAAAERRCASRPQANAWPSSRRRARRAGRPAATSANPHRACSSCARRGQRSRARGRRARPLPKCARASRARSPRPLRIRGAGRRPAVVEAVRAGSASASPATRAALRSPAPRSDAARPARARAWFDGWRDVPLLERAALADAATDRRPGAHRRAAIPRPSCWNPAGGASGCADGTAPARAHEPRHGAPRVDQRCPDPAQLELFNHRFMQVAEQMGAVLQATAQSRSTSSERLDFSCALFDADGRADRERAAHAGAPRLDGRERARGHRGASRARCSPATRLAAEQPLRRRHAPAGHHGGDARVPRRTAPTPAFFVASRAHHADIGGITPGSMPPVSRDHRRGRRAVRQLPARRRRRVPRSGAARTASRARPLARAQPRPERRRPEGAARRERARHRRARAR